MLKQTCPQCDFIFLGDDLPEEGCPACGGEWAEHDSAEPAPDLLSSVAGAETPAGIEPISASERAPLAADSSRKTLRLCGWRTAAVMLVLAGIIAWQQFERTRRSDDLADADGRMTDLEEQLAEKQRRLNAAAEALAEARDALRRATGDVESLKQTFAESQAALVREQARLQELEGRFRALARRTNHSFARSWQLLGPFPYRAEEAGDPADGEPFRTAATYEGVGGTVRWRPFESEDDRVNFAEFFKTKERVVCYAVCWVYSDSEREVTLSLGSDDGMQLWLNRAPIYTFDNQRSATAGQDTVAARLNAGWNEIRARVDNRGSADWALYLEFRTADNSIPLKLFSTQAPPASFLEELNAAETNRTE